MADPTTPPAGGKWYDSLVNLALKGADVYGKIQEVKASTKPNNVTVYRDEEINPATGKPYGVQPTSSAGVSTPSATPAWILPVSIGGGILIIVLVVLGLRSGKK